MSSSRPSSSGSTAPTRSREAPAAESDTMTPERFRAWRKRLGLKQKEAADRLGLKKRMIQYYEKGARDGRPVEIPLAVRLACYAISAGVTDFDGRATSRTPLGATSPATVAEPVDDDMPDAPPAART
uniref:helix-turn-helix domain-containing protein n=1 Tax=Stappia sp. TaxID=1870903 RepID=UPI003BA90AAF